MAEIKLTKNELRDQQNRLNQLQKYLPTLQLKKAMLQVEVHNAKADVAEMEAEFLKKKQEVQQYAPLFVEHTSIDFNTVAIVAEVKKSYENIAGVEIPTYEGIEFRELQYSLFETPPWVDWAVKKTRDMAETKVKGFVGEEKVEALSKELREVSIRVNLFEKILIPKSQKNIKKIVIFLGDQQLAAVSQAKVAKAKIEEHKRKHREEELCA